MVNNPLAIEHVFGYSSQTPFLLLMAPARPHAVQLNQNDVTMAI